MRSAAIPLALLGLCAACTPSAGGPQEDAQLIARDPVVARALHDPLLTDPDLASRNEANAAISFIDSAALPVMAPQPAEARKMVEVMRIDLLEGGPLTDLPAAEAGPGGAVLGPTSDPADLLGAVDAPAECAATLREDFALAASLPPVAMIPPRAMVMQAGGTDAPGCGVRIVRYATAAPVEDVLHYHYTRAARAGLAPRRFAKPADSMAAGFQGGERIVVHLRRTPQGLTGVTLVYRSAANP